eukprot:TRINITY_DN4011_c0_g1_i1.p1 TRINITY_DN4011_c0_g1~~TRINITY_DN4011_c0_g1_i1.p1  ORF type:complete len:150 (-),score=14.97 TRINITY_DN4011_c0_g1_i1:210-659(-)
MGMPLPRKFSMPMNGIASPKQGRVCRPRKASASPPGLRKSPDLTVAFAPQATRATADRPAFDVHARSRHSPSKRVSSPSLDDTVTAASPGRAALTRPKAVVPTFSNPSAAWNFVSGRRFIPPTAEDSPPFLCTFSSAPKCCVYVVYVCL